jgi:hypothetical protein
MNLSYIKGLATRFLHGPPTQNINFGLGSSDIDCLIYPGDGNDKFHHRVGFIVLIHNNKTRANQLAPTLATLSFFILVAPH